MKRIFLSIALFSTGCFFGQTNFLVENFEIPAGSSLSANGWYVHSATANPIVASNGGLSLATTPYIGSGVGNAALVTNTGIDVNKPLAANMSDGSTYASFLFKPSGAITSAGTGDYFFHFLKYTNETTPDYAATNSAARGKVFIIKGTTPAQFKLGLSFNANAYDLNNATADLDITKTYLVVVKYTFVPGADNDTVSMYVFADGQDITAEPSAPTVGPLSMTGASAGTDIGVIQGIALRQTSAGQNASVGGIYVRNTWDLINPGILLGVDTFTQNNSLKVYPNPVENNRVTVFLAIEGEKEITLFDLSGRIILQKTMDTDELDLANVNKGVYLLQTKVGTHTSTTKLIVN